QSSLHYHRRRLRLGRAGAGACGARRVVADHPPRPRPPRCLGERRRKALSRRDFAGSSRRPAAAGAGLYRAGLPHRPAEGGLYGACGRGGAHLAIAGGLYCFAAAVVAAASGGRRPPQARRHRVDVMRQVMIRGRVQGGGFRAWTEYTALERGLQGWVRNRRDGAVEALLVSPPDAVAAMIAACRQGPRASHVDGIDQRDGTAEELKLRRPGELFSLLPTA